MDRMTHLYGPIGTQQVAGQWLSHGPANREMTAPLAAIGPEALRAVTAVGVRLQYEMRVRWRGSTRWYQMITSLPDDKAQCL